MGNLKSFRRVLVTGATGFLGGHVVDRLRAEGVSVIVVGRDDAKCAQLAARGLDVIAHDISQRFGEIQGPPIDAVIHCAALSAPFGKRRDFMRANVEGTANVIALAQRHRVRRFVHISTPSVYFSFCDQMDMAETSPIPPPVNHYAETKLMAEELVQNADGLNAIILRPRGIYGPGDTALLPRVLRAARARPLPLLRNGGAQIDLTYVDDVVDAVLAGLEADDSAIGEVFNISGGEPLPIRHIVEKACAMEGIAPRWRPMPLGPAMFAARAIEAVASVLPHAPEPIITRYGLGLFAYAQSLNISKAKTMLGWSPKVNFEDGLRRTFEGAS